MRNESTAPMLTTTVEKINGVRAPWITPASSAARLSSELTTATPSADPSMRTVVLAPLVAPARSAGTSERITLLSCEPANPMPMPNTAKPGSSATNENEATRRPA